MIFLGQVGADTLHNGGTFAESLAHFGIDNEVEIASSITDVDVGQALVFVRERQDSLGQNLKSQCPSIFTI